jgi:hypothetical protein
MYPSAFGDYRNGLLISDYRRKYHVLMFVLEELDEFVSRYIQFSCIKVIYISGIIFGVRTKVNAMIAPKKYKHSSDVELH